MGDTTKIEWADSTWSPWRGCTKISPGCANCYAEKQAKRNPSVLGMWGPGAPRVYNKDWDHVRRGNRRCAEFGVRKRIFPSLCDWLDDDVSVPIGWFVDFMRLILDTPHLDWLLLTKRPENWDVRISNAIALAARNSTDPDLLHWLMDWRAGSQPPSNVWFGVSVEDQTRANDRIPLLLQIPARVRWLSIEPLLGPVDLCCVNDGSWWDKEGANKYCALRGIAYWLQHGSYDHGLGGGPNLDWLIVGGESGPKARPCSISWINDIVSSARISEVPVFVKQIGSNAVVPDALDTDRTIEFRTHHPKGGDPAEWPENLRVREFPKLS